MSVVKEYWRCDMAYQYIMEKGNYIRQIPGAHGLYETQKVSYFRVKVHSSADLGRKFVNKGLRASARQ